MSVTRLTIIAFALVFTTLAACSSEDVPEPTDAITLAPSGRDCLRRTVDGVASEVCIIRGGGTVSIEADGLNPGSSLEIEGSAADTLVFEIGSESAIQSDIGGKLVATSFSVRGTWADGEPLFLLVEYAD